MNDKKNQDRIVVLTGGTINKVAPHFAVCAPAYGSIGERFARKLGSLEGFETVLIKTKMADSKFHHESFKGADIKAIETNDDLKKYIKHLSGDRSVKAVVMSCAVADFKIETEKEGRLDSSKSYSVTLIPSEKLLGHFRDDIIVVSFKTLFGEDDEEKARAKAVKNMDSSDLVFVNDIKNRTNGIAVGGEYRPMPSREEAIGAACFYLYHKLGRLSFECPWCGRAPLPWREVKRRCSCGNRRSVMGYDTILRYKYGLKVS